jgi:hypothetical protein
MLTLLAATAVIFGVTILGALVAILAFLSQIRSLMAQTAAALDGVDDGAARLSGHLHRTQQSTHAAASQLPAREK